MKLVIVESPAKCTTIQKYLGKDYIVKASLGHIRDLATSGKGGLGVDVDNGFAPTYIINKNKYSVVKELQSLKKSSDEVILATDPDREGEAIAWHLANVLDLDINNNKRWEFHEITRDSISEASQNPRIIDMNIVSSQETRRILDRIIGFKLSTLLNKKIHSRSAGRVQSATLKLIYDHELEIDKFVPEEYYDINVKANFLNKDTELTYVSYLDDNKEVKDAETAKKIIDSIPSDLKVVDIKKTIRSVESKEPFTTSTMQQEAFAKLKFKTKKTQMVAQMLYEGITVDNEHVGLITYMRTDSTRLSPTFIQRATAYINETFGSDYLGHPKKIKEIGNVQDAHEAIRPTSNHRTPESVRQYLTPDQYNLYKLIYDRAVASLMKAKKEEVMDVTLDGNGVKFKIEMVRTVFKGYTAIYKEDTNKFHDFPSVNEGDSFIVTSKEAVQKFTQAPAHYSEAKIVKLMEEVGIGRPSTYASTIETLIKRKYVTDDKGILLITEQGRKTAHVLEKYFPNIVSTKYTADMETKLDDVQDGSKSRLDMLTNFYNPFMEDLDKANQKMYVDEVIPTGEKCPICGAPLIYREGKNGQFIGCSKYPKCEYVKKEPKKEAVFVGRNCPECGKPLVEREDNKGNKFVACSGFPNCKYIEAKTTAEHDPTKFIKKCPDCEDGQLIKKKGKFGYFLGCTNYPKCKHMEPLKKSWKRK